MGRGRATPRRVDANQGEIVDALRRVGCHILDLSTLGRGVPDLLVSYHNVLHLMEIKVKGGRLNKRQQKWHDEWRGRKPTVVYSVDQALAAIGIGAQVAAQNQAGDSTRGTT